jgi:DNA-binding transcriptional ArsR family regulator
VEAAVRALAEPRRRDILRLVRDDELSAGSIASHFEVSRPAISQHLRVLKEAGLVDERRDGTRRMYRARPEGFDELRKYLDDLWGEGLARMKSAAEADHRAQRKGRRRGSA